MSKPEKFYEFEKTYYTKDGEERKCICKTRYQPKDNPRGRPSVKMTLSEIKKYKETINKHGGNIKKSAEELNVPYSRLYRLK